MILRALSTLWTSFAPPMADHLWQSTLFVVLAAILAFALRKNQGRVRYWVWLTASVKFLIPFSLLIALGSHLAKPRVSTPVQAVVYSAVEDFSQPFAGPETPLTSQAPPPVSRFHLLPPIIVAVWLAGIVVVLLVWATGWIRVSLMVRRAVPLREGPEVEALRRLESSCGVRKPIRLVLSRNWMEPGIFGTLRPVLIWPEGISLHLDDRHIDAILAHEICHARRHDNLTAILHMLVEAVFWFHPLVWWMGARLEEERERACDEEVSLRYHQPHVYAESILRVCKFCSESPLACVSGITGADLKKRILQIMTERVVRKLDLGRKLLLLAVGLAVVAVPIVLGQAQAAKRMMLAALRSVPEPFSAAAHAMIAEEQTPATALIAEAQGAAPATDERALGPAFEVASIRPSAPDPVMMRWQPTNDGLIVNAQSLKTLITYAYGVLPEYVLGGPDWESSQLFDINAKYGEKETDALAKLPPKERGEQTKAILRTLLAERFKLKVRRETKESPIYELTVAKGGSKLTESPPLVAGPDGRVPPEGGGTTWFPDGRHVMKRTSMLMFASALSRDLDVAREVVDSTGLKGPYDFEYTWKQSPDSSGPSLFTALQEQLGLKLVASKGPIETLVIDHAERPSVDGSEVPGQASAMAAAMVQANAKWVFDVVSVRVQDPKERIIMGPHGTAEDFEAKGVTAETLIAYAYDLPWTQGMTVSRDPRYLYQAHSPTLLGDPAWASAVQFDLIAKADPATVEAWKRLPPREQATRLKEMVLAMMADRFQLKVHTEKRDMPAYALVVAKGGPKISPITGPPPTFNDGSDPSKPYQSPWDGGDLGQIKGHGVTIDGLAEQLWVKRELGSKKVIDQTGLTGRYDFTLKWTPEGDPDDAGGVSLFTAIQEQLGLKLEPVKAPMDVAVIDHIERPSEN